jgi:elongation factor 2
MPRFKQVGQIQALMNRKENIRNIGIIAHIDHGKTTLADSLLAGVGLLSPRMAGTARVLDYLDEEQKRKITIKTANISLLHKAGDESFIINLVDTPGHVDFTGRVTRALRAIDGAVVLVDAVEEIMAQTEIVTRQALEERVRPVLFINKIDRLITELQLNAEQVEKKLNRIIGSFNDLVELHAEPRFRTDWKVNAMADSVVFGSALHGWGFTLGMARERNVKFHDIVKAYQRKEEMELQKLLHVYDAVFELSVKHLPNPLQAQAYRMEAIWKGNVSSAMGQAMATCNPKAVAVMCITNVQSEPEGTVAIGRLFAGTVKEGDRLFGVNAKVEAVVNRVFVDMGAFREEVAEVSAGNLMALLLSERVKAGETLVDSSLGQGVVPFESIRYVSEPVVTVALEPKNPKDLPLLAETMDKLAAEDPNLTVMVNRETGEYLLSGMGELHLEVALNQLKSTAAGIQVVSSEPRVVYREAATQKGETALSRSPNKQNKFAVSVESLEKALAEQLDMDEKPEVEGVVAVDEYRNMLIDCRGKERLADDAMEFIVGGFKFSCAAGPLCGEPLRHVKVNLLDVELSENEEQRNSVELMHGVGKAVFGSFLSAKPVLLEPVYRTVISAPVELSGECSRIVGSRRGRVCGFEQKDGLMVITGLIPVAETFGLAQELRSATSGRAFWQSVHDHWEQVPEKLGEKVVAELRKRKGLPLELPVAKRFMEEP